MCIAMCIGMCIDMGIDVIFSTHMSIRARTGHSVGDADDGTADVEPI